MRALFSSIGTATSLAYISPACLSMELRALLRWISASDPASTIDRAYETREAASLFWTAYDPENIRAATVIFAIPYIFIILYKIYYDNI